MAAARRTPTSGTLSELQRAQEERRHHQLGPLRYVIDRLGDERMDHPDQRDRECEQVERRFTRRQIDLAGRKGPPYNPEQQQGIDDVDRDVDEPVAADVQAAQRVVDRERQADERTAGQRRPCSVGASDVERCRICSLTTIAWSSSKANGAVKLFQ